MKVVELDIHEQTPRGWHRWLPARVSWWLERDLSAGNGRSRLSNWWHERKYSSRSRRRCAVILRVLPWFFGIIGLGALLLLYLSRSSGSWHHHSDTGVPEFRPDSTSPLGSIQTRLLRHARPFPVVTEGELLMGHAHVLVPNPGLLEPLGTSTDTHFREAIVRLDLLEVALTEHCRAEECTCASAAQVGVPLRVLHIPRLGMLLNPTIVYARQPVDNVTYTSPLLAYTGISYLEVTLRHQVPDRQWQVINRRFSHLEGQESICAWIILTQESEPPPPPQKQSVSEHADGADD